MASSTVEDAIAYLNQAAADSYARDGDKSPYGWAYSIAATRLHAAIWQEELNR